VETSASILWSAGDSLTLAGLAFAWLLFRAERLATHRREIDSAIAALKSLQQVYARRQDTGDAGWGETYFGRGYDQNEALERAQGSSAAIMEGRYDQVFVVPREPLSVASVKVVYEPERVILA